MVQGGPVGWTTQAVMDAISSDFEPLHEIVQQVGLWAQEDERVPAMKQEVERILAQLVADGLAEAWHLTPLKRVKHEVVSADSAAFLCFGLTKTGQAVLAQLAEPI